MIEVMDSKSMGVRVCIVIMISIPNSSLRNTKRAPSVVLYQERGSIRHYYVTTKVGGRDVIFCFLMKNALVVHDVQCTANIVKFLFTT